MRNIWRIMCSTYVRTGWNSMPSASRTSLTGLPLTLAVCGQLTRWLNSWKPMERPSVARWLLLKPLAWATHTSMPSTRQASSMASTSMVVISMVAFSQPIRTSPRRIRNSGWQNSSSTGMRTSRKARVVILISRKTSLTSSIASTPACWATSTHGFTMPPNAITVC